MTSAEIQITVQPSLLHVPAGMAGGQWIRGIPTPGAPMGADSIPPVLGMGTCANLIPFRTPTVLEEFGIYSYSIGYGIFAQPDLSATGGQMIAELALLVSGQTRFVASETLNLRPEPGGLPGCWCSGSWTADFNNPLRVNASSGLALRIGAQPSATVTYLDMYVGVQQQPDQGVLGPLEFASTITYEVRDLTAAQ